MGLLDFIESAAPFKITDHTWRGYVIDNDDPDKLGRVRVLVPRIFDTGKYDEDEYPAYPWATPDNPKLFEVPDKRKEVSVWFNAGNMDDVVYGPPQAHDQTLPALPVETVRDWNNFLFMLRTYREDGVESPELDPEEDDENKNPLIDERYMAEPDEDSAIDPPIEVLPDRLPLKIPTLAGLEGLPEDYPLDRVLDEGYPEVAVAQIGDGFAKIDRQKGSMQGRVGRVDFHQDRNGNTTVQAPRIDFNPAPKWGGPDEEGRVSFTPPKGRRGINGGNFVSSDFYVNGFPVVLGGGGGGQFWNPRPLTEGEVSAGEEIDPFAFKVVVSHVNGYWTPANRDETFTLSPGGKKEMWVRIDLDDDRNVSSCALEMGDEVPVPEVVKKNDYVPEFSAYHIFTISANDEGIDYDYPTGTVQYATGPLTFVLLMSDASNKGVFWNGTWFAGS